MKYLSFSYSDKAKRAPGCSFSYFRAMSYTTSPHLNSPLRVFCVHGLFLSGENQSKTDSPMVSFHPRMRLVLQGCWKGFVCIITKLRPPPRRTMPRTDQSSSISSALSRSSLEDVGGVGCAVGSVGMLLMRKAMCVMPPRWRASMVV